jgi:tetratricopeptide (TPR) repeat protein
MSVKTANPSAAFIEALHLRQEGKSDAAILKLRQTHELLQASLGASSEETLHALFERAWMLRDAGKHSESIPLFERLNQLSQSSPSVHPVDRTAYQLNHGIALLEAQRLPEAEAVIRQNAQERAKVFGVDHPEYGLCLEYFAKTLAGQGKIQEAAQAIDAVMGSYWKHNVPRLGHALFLRSVLSLEIRPDEDPFASLQLPASAIVEIAEQLLQDLDRNPASVLNHRPIRSIPLLKGLLKKLESIPETPPLLLLQTKASLARQYERMDPKSPDRIPLIRSLAAFWTTQDNLPESFHAHLHLALCLADQETGFGETLQAFHDAIRISANLTGLERSVAFRQYGLFLLRNERWKEAEAQLKAALRESERLQNQELIGRAEIALGILDVSSSEFISGIEQLERGLTSLKPTDADALLARRYRAGARQAVAEPRGTLDEALCEAFSEKILSRYPNNFFRHFEVTIKDDQFILNLDPATELSQIDLEALQRLIADAIEMFRDAMQVSNP